MTADEADNIIHWEANNSIDHETSFRSQWKAEIRIWQKSASIIRDDRIRWEVDERATQ